MECPEKIRSYMEALTEEQRKIQVFQRELPLCMELVTQAIEACKQQLSGSTTATTTSMEEMNGQISECSELNSNKASPVLEEFIPMKTSSEHVNDERLSGNYGLSENDKKKSNWLKSAQLWNHNPEATHVDKDPPSTKRASVFYGNSTDTFVSIHNGEKPAVPGNSRLSPGRAVSPLRSPDAAVASTSSSAEKGCNEVSKKEETIKQKTSAQRKQRRCWSSDLHRRFLNALQQLGGPHVATPKQIRELMKIDCLTNDEVKSHLQKYRLHAKNSPSQNSGGSVHQQPQFVVVGGIWMPQPQYTTVASSPGEACGIFAPVATPLHSKANAQAPQKPSRSNSDEDQYEAHGSSNSATTSCSTHTVSVC